MKFAIVVACVSLASCAALPSSPAPQGPTALRENRVSLYLGQRSLDDDWEPVEDQPTFGVEYSQERAGSAIGWEVGLMGSSDDDTVNDAVLGNVDVDVSTFEVYGGVKKSFGDGAVRPFVGAGISIINADIEASDSTSSASDDDTSIGGYGHGGVRFDVSESFYLGLDLRLLFGSDYEIGGVDFGANYVQYALILGWAF